MSTFAQEITLYLDSEKQQVPARFFASDNTLNTLADVGLVQGDCLLLRLYICRPAKTLGAKHTFLHANGPIILALYDRIGEGRAQLAQTAAWEAHVDADSGDVHYEAIFNLNTPAANAAIPGAAANIKARLAIELQIAGNTRRKEFSTPCTLHRQLIDGTDPAQPTPPPQYPPPEDIPSIANVGNLIHDEVSQQLPGLVGDKVATAAGAIPRVAGVESSSLPPQEQATAELVAEDGENPQNLTLRLGIPRGERGADGVVSSVPMGAAGAEFALPSGPGSASGTVALPQAFPTAASYQLVATLVAPAGATVALSLQVLDKTASTFSYQLSDEVPAGEAWKISYLVLTLGGDASTGYVLPPATTATLGGVRVGDGLAADAQGRLRTQWAHRTGRWSFATTLPQNNTIAVPTLLDDPEFAAATSLPSFAISVQPCFLPSVGGAFIASAVNEIDAGLSTWWVSFKPLTEWPPAGHPARQYMGFVWQASWLVP
ncbi:MAG: hypothetical protein LBG65_07610 [Puniceicoccales bacterium]|jgi:hypothetical protein|nr:hypothetical protein [Puniceicoccales bacterium]